MSWLQTVCIAAVLQASARALGPLGVRAAVHVGVRAVEGREPLRQGVAAAGRADLGPLAAVGAGTVVGAGDRDQVVRDACIRGLLGLGGAGEEKGGNEGEECASHADIVPRACRKGKWSVRALSSSFVRPIVGRKAQTTKPPIDHPGRKKMK